MSDLPPEPGSEPDLTYGLTPEQSGIPSDEELPENDGNLDHGEVAIHPYPDDDEPDAFDGATDETLSYEDAPAHLDDPDPEG